jgi:threonine dehydrogenase-like Zn-dependent dehydrogenase
MTQDHIYKLIFPEARKAELETHMPDLKPMGFTEVAGRTLYSLISAGTEINQYLGVCYQMGLPWGTFPINPGYAAVFQIEAVGGDVSDLRAGDLAFCMGPHSSYQRLPREAVIPVPAGLNPEIAPFARLMNITMSTLTTTTARPPAKVLVTGLGPVGFMGALIFARCGYEVIACDPIESRCQRLREAGIKEVYSQVPVDDPAIKGQIDLVLECSAHEQAVLDGLSVIGRGCEVVLVGVPMPRKTEMYAQEIIYKVFRNFGVLRSGTEWEVPNYPADYRKNSIFGNQAAALKWLREGSIKVDGLYSKVSPKDAQKIYENLVERRYGQVGIVLDWTTIY